jgi:hypothetical protein
MVTRLKLLPALAALVAQLICTDSKLVSSDSSRGICIWPLDDIPDQFEAYHSSVIGLDSNAAKKKLTAVRMD